MPPSDTRCFDRQSSAQSPWPTSQRPHTLHPLQQSLLPAVLETLEVTEAHWSAQQLQRWVCKPWLAQQPVCTTRSLLPEPQPMAQAASTRPARLLQPGLPPGHTACLQVAKEQQKALKSPLNTSSTAFCAVHAACASDLVAARPPCGLATRSRSTFPRRSTARPQRLCLAPPPRPARCVPPLQPRDLWRSAWAQDTSRGTRRQRRCEQVESTCH
eukprot:5898088-Prymnesium_polylepis.1